MHINVANFHLTLYLFSLEWLELPFEFIVNFFGDLKQIP